jgi:hypothetical protein
MPDPQRHTPSEALVATRERRHTDKHKHAYKDRFQTNRLHKTANEIGTNKKGRVPTTYGNNWSGLCHIIIVRKRRDNG